LLLQGPGLTAAYGQGCGGGVCGLAWCDSGSDDACGGLQEKNNKNRSTTAARVGQEHAGYTMQKGDRWRAIKHAASVQKKHAAESWPVAHACLAGSTLRQAVHSIFKQYNLMLDWMQHDI
jgi:hypothetical protein